MPEREGEGWGRGGGRRTHVETGAGGLEVDGAGVGLWVRERYESVGWTGGMEWRGRRGD